MRIGATTLPVAGWVIDPSQPELERVKRLTAIRQLVEKYKLSAVELTLDLAYIFPEVFEASLYQDVANLQQKLGFTCSIHLPFLWLDASSLNEPIRQTSSECIRWAVELTHPIQVETYVVHLWGFTTMRITSELKNPHMLQAAVLSKAKKSLVELYERVDPQKICVENLEFPSFEFVEPLVESCGVNICLDVGHLAWQGGGEVEFYTRHRQRIGEIHLHDAKAPKIGDHQTAQDHLPLGQGEIDILGFLHELEKYEFGGAVILENNTREDLEISLEYLEKYLISK